MNFLKFMALELFQCAFSQCTMLIASFVHSFAFRRQGIYYYYSYRTTRYILSRAAPNVDTSKSKMQRILFPFQSCILHLASSVQAGRLAGHVVQMQRQHFYMNSPCKPIPMVIPKNSRSDEECLWWWMVAIRVFRQAR